MPDKQRKKGYTFSDEDREKAIQKRTINSLERVNRVQEIAEPLISQIQPISTLTNIKKLFMDLAEIKALREFIQGQPLGQTQAIQQTDIKDNLELFEKLDSLIDKRVQRFINSMPESENTEDMTQKQLEQAVLMRFLGFNNTPVIQQIPEQITDEQIIALLQQIPKGIKSAIKKGTIKKPELKKMLAPYNVPDSVFERAYTLLIQ